MVSQEPAPSDELAQEGEEPVALDPDLVPDLDQESEQDPVQETESETTTEAEDAVAAQESEVEEFEQDDTLTAEEEEEVSEELPDEPVDESVDVSSDDLSTLSAPLTATPPDPNFPGGISPSHVFARLTLVEATLDHMLAFKEIEAPEAPAFTETTLGPLHVYQLMTTCNDHSQLISAETGTLAVPTMVAKPRSYAPQDIFTLVDSLFVGLNQACAEFGMDELSTLETAVEGKNLTNVYEVGVRVLTKLNAMSAEAQATPSTVFAQMRRATSDVRSILRQSDPACRYRIDAPASPADRSASNVYELCLEIRRDMNPVLEAAGMPATEVPDADAGADQWVSACIQSQILIAELNRLKIALNTPSSTPLVIPVEGKTPTDVFGELLLTQYLLQQIKLP